jgi:hypothetical protein
MSWKPTCNSDGPTINALPLLSGVLGVQGRTVMPYDMGAGRRIPGARLRSSDVLDILEAALAIIEDDDSTTPEEDQDAPTVQ